MWSWHFQETKIHGVHITDNFTLIDWQNVRTRTRLAMIPASLLTGIRKILHEFCRGDAEGLEAILDGAIADSDCQMGFPRHTMAKKIDSINLLTWMVVCDRGMRRQLPENTRHKTISQ